MHVLGQCAKARLGLLDEILVVAGWENSGSGWMPPLSYKEAVEQVGHGSWSRENALRFMVQSDERMATE